jgi:hypothetical protein
MATKKITLTELRSLVKNIVKEEHSKKKRVIKESDNDLPPLEKNDRILEINVNNKSIKGIATEDFDGFYTSKQVFNFSRPLYDEDALEEYGSQLYLTDFYELYTYSKNQFTITVFPKGKQ